MPNTEFSAVAIEDRLAIADQVARYSWAIDSGDMDEYLGCFWEDGAIEHPLPDGTSHRFVGPEAIRGWLGPNFEERPTQTYGHQHQFSALRMSPRGDDVQVDAYISILRHDFFRQYWPTGPSFRLGTWHALYGRQDREWRLKLVQVRMWTDTGLGGAGSANLPFKPGQPGARR